MGKSETAQGLCQDWLADHGCRLGDLDGELFVIVPGWNTANTPGFEYIVETAAGSKYQWGFYDEYDWCGDCGVVIRTSPDSHSWQPDFWLSDGNGYICKDCTRDYHEDEYLEWAMDHTQGVRIINTDIIHPEDYEFVVVLQGCEIGLHEHQNEDPRAVVKWCKDNGLQVVFDTSQGQFDTSWDAYMRMVDGTALTDEMVEKIRVELVAHYYGEGYRRRDSLKGEFRQTPSPAQRVKEQLQQLDKMGARFATVGGEDGPVVYGSFEEMRLG